MLNKKQDSLENKIEGIKKTAAFAHIVVRPITVWNDFYQILLYT